MTNTMVGGSTVTTGRVTTSIPRPVSTGRITARSKRASRNMLRTAAALILAIFVLVGLSAYAASIQHANNVLTRENEYLQAEIDSLNSQIVEETKVTKVEEIATNKYGMVYPTSDNCVVIDESEDSSTSLATTIRREAYN